MTEAINQRKAKVWIRDYLRATGRKGVTSLIKEIQRHTGTAIFSQRAFEKWLVEQERMLQEDNWIKVLSFIRSDTFRKHVPYANEGHAEDRLRKVAAGFVALYSEGKQSKGLYIMPSVIEAEGQKAVTLLDGRWENKPNLASGDVPRAICRMESVPGTRVAKFAYIALFHSKEISATGIVIYLNSEVHDGYDYTHTFVLQLWRRRDPESGSNMPGRLTYLKLTRGQPEFSIAETLNRYFYKDDDPITRRGPVVYGIGDEGKPMAELPVERKFRLAFNASAGSMVVLKRTKDTSEEENIIIDQLMEDVLPHGYA
ncbi:MAG: hypothetical protein AB7E72_01595 [Lysobacterales bacterium]